MSVSQVYYRGRWMNLEEADELVLADQKKIMDKKRERDAINKESKS